MGWWFAPGIASITSFVFLIATYASDDEISNDLRIILLTIVILSTLTLVIPCSRTCQSQKNQTKGSEEVKKFASTIDGTLRPSSAIMVLLISPSVAYLLVLILRLFLGADLWDPSNPLNLDFGPKYGVGDGGDNISFLKEFNSFTHGIEGVFASLLVYPATKGLVIRCNAIYPWVDLLAAVLHVYPTYNLIKRTFFSLGWEAFAGSSFSSNGMEWALGYVVGTSGALLLTSIAKEKFLFQFNKEQDGVFDNQGSVRGSLMDFGQSNLCGLPRLVVMSFGFLTIISGFVTAGLCGLTWNNCLDEDGDSCVNYSDGLNIGILVMFLAIPTIMFIHTMLRERARTKSASIVI